MEKSSLFSSPYKILERADEMPSYNKSDFAFNRNSTSILYLLPNGKIREITKEFFLKEVPNSSEEQWLVLKNESDNMFEQEMKNDTKQTQIIQKQSRQLKHDVLLQQPMNFDEMLIIGEELEHIRLVTTEFLTGTLLTEVQKRRFFLHYIKGFSYREIGTHDKAHFTSVQESINASRKKFIIFYKSFE